MQEVRLDRVALALDLQRREPLEHRAGRQGGGGLGAHDHLAHRRLRLQPSGQVDGVADHAVLAMAARAADEAGEDLTAVDRGAEMRPVGVGAATSVAAAWNSSAVLAASAAWSGWSPRWLKITMTASPMIWWTTPPCCSNNGTSRPK